MDAGAQEAAAAPDAAFLSSTDVVVLAVLVVVVIAVILYRRSGKTAPPKSTFAIKTPAKYVARALSTRAGPLPAPSRLLTEAGARAGVLCVGQWRGRGRKEGEQSQHPGQDERAGRRRSHTLLPAGKAPSSSPLARRPPTYTPSPPLA